MAKLRHFAIVVQDPEQSEKFFETVFNMRLAGYARRGRYVSDGVVNDVLLNVESVDERLGFTLFGMWVDDLDTAEKKVVDSDGTYLSVRPTSPHSLYEAKYRNLDGVVFDLAHNGWARAGKDVVPKT